jgi:hypothetical protein
MLLLLVHKFLCRMFYFWSFIYPVLIHVIMTDQLYGHVIGTEIFFGIRTQAISYKFHVQLLENGKQDL